jgi:ligand-binding sensor domain-containing protein
VNDVEAPDDSNESTMKRRSSVPGLKPTISRVSYVLGAFNAIRRSFALLPLAFFLFAAESSTFALDPHQSVDQLYHSAWGPKQGITGAVTALAQTTDGYLWLGTTDGLLRFNGISFERYQPENGQLVANAISALLAVPDDGLWVGFVRGGASFLKNGHVANYTEAQGFPVSKVRALVLDNAGMIWAAAIGGLTRFDGERWHNIGKDWNYPTKSAWTLFTDREGRLWAATGERIVVFPTGATKFQDTRIACSEVHGITQAPDGTLMIDDEVANRLRALRLDSDGKPTTLPDIPVPSGVPFVDRDGSLWVATTHGVVRVPSLDWSRADKTQAQFFAEKQGLTNDTTADVIEDREGNVWVGTQEGLDRFRNRNLSWFSLPGSYLTLVAGPRGDVWAASADPWPVPFLRVRDRKGVGTGPAAIHAVFRDRDGSVWY